MLQRGLRMITQSAHLATHNTSQRSLTSTTFCRSADFIVDEDVKYDRSADQLRPLQSTSLGAVLRASRPFFVIAGPCAAESAADVRAVGEVLSRVRARLGISVVLKASFDKANRTSEGAFRGVGISVAAQWMGRVRDEYAIPTLTDVHHPAQVPLVAPHFDILQIPAFLCRQTDLIHAAARSSRIVNIKKGQFAAPWHMLNAAHKARAAVMKVDDYTPRSFCEILRGC
eukprot:TRINITY_DN7789_c0_g1_i2.p1 TRINITY_DN7789_c0_g1~~TRINITY_DN7789_c0_g1_i2.p1  ORF type:complete len:228 (+),score=29.23 TRINITY_DN7789_c0_g1_i2:50-733(+)